MTIHVQLVHDIRSKASHLLRALRCALTGRIACLAILGCCVSTVACERENASPPAADVANALTPVVFLAVVPPESMTFAPELLAQAAGYFGDEGLEVTMEMTRGSAQATQMILSDRAPLSRISLIDGMRAVANRDAPLTDHSQIVKPPGVAKVAAVLYELISEAQLRRTGIDGRLDA